MVSTAAEGLLFAPMYECRGRGVGRCLVVGMLSSYESLFREMSSKWVRLSGAVESERMDDLYEEDVEVFDDFEEDSSGGESGVGVW